ncbi:MAG: hypothetical protein HOV83_17190 [Catenulispora sp.]|nr:hypothetical protein [Catenulispora sp.]
MTEPDRVTRDVLAIIEDVRCRLFKRLEGLTDADGDRRLLAPIGMGPGGWDRETYLKLALHALDEVAHHGGEIGLLRDLYLRRESWLRRDLRLRDDV